MITNSQLITNYIILNVNRFLFVTSAPIKFYYNYLINYNKTVETLRNHSLLCSPDIMSRVLKSSSIPAALAVIMTALQGALNGCM